MAVKKSKKVLQQKVAETLKTTFGGLKDEISPKKFKRNIKKASKALVAGLKTSAVKKSKEKKKAKPAAAK